MERLKSTNICKAAARQAEIIGRKNVRHEKCFA